MRECLIELKQQTENSISPTRDVYEFVASALLMDAYPLGIHGMYFDQSHYTSVS